MIFHIHFLPEDYMKMPGTFCMCMASIELWPFPKDDGQKNLNQFTAMEEGLCERRSGQVRLDYGTIVDSYPGKNIWNLFGGNNSWF